MRLQAIRVVVGLLLIGGLAGGTTGWAQGVWRERVKKRVDDRRQRRRADPREAASEVETFSLTHNGQTRFYLLHVPRGHQPDRAMPLVLAFHGGGGNSRVMADDRLYHLISKSDAEGFMIVFPNGASRLPGGAMATWNAGNCCAYARDSQSDDVGFVRALLQDVRARWNINPRRIFALGMSNGGMFAYRLACEMAGTFRAVAAVAGTDNYDACSPAVPVSVLHIHAHNDGHVLFNGGAGEDAFRDSSRVTDFTSVPETIARWVERNGCSPVPVVKTFKTGGVSCEEYTGCRDHTAVELCITEQGGHSWPGGARPRPQADTPTKALDAADVIWDFFQRHAK